MAMPTKKHNLLVVDYGFQCGRVFSDQFAKTREYKNQAQIDSHSVIIFEGGNDISSALYDEPKGMWTQPAHFKRDRYEVDIFKVGRARGAAFIGICRGAQLLTALSGGSIFQDVTGHTGAHPIATDTDKIISTTSIHHQMMNPYVLPDEDYQIVAWAIPKGQPGSKDSPEGLSTHYLNGNNVIDFVPDKEPEVVWYPRTRSLCIQGHPEYATVNGPFYQYCKALVNRFILFPEHNKIRS